MNNKLTLCTLLLWPLTPTSVPGENCCITLLLGRKMAKQLVVGAQRNTNAHMYVSLHRGGGGPYSNSYFFL